MLTEILIDLENQKYAMTHPLHEIDLDIPSIIDTYVKGYVRHSHEHETLDEFADRVAGDLKMAEAREWALDAVKKLKAR